jgi:predicted dehydrogenase
LSDPDDPHHVPGARIVAGFPSFSADLQISAPRVAGYTEELRDKNQLEIVDSNEALLNQVNAVLLESVDGRRHLAEATPIIKACKPLFIDKPFAANYDAAAAVAALADEYNCSIFSSSSLRYDANFIALRSDASLGSVLACAAYSPAKIEPTNPGTLLLWHSRCGDSALFPWHRLRERSLPPYR